MWSNDQPCGSQMQYLHLPNISWICQNRLEKCNRSCLTVGGNPPQIRDPIQNLCLETIIRSYFNCPLRECGLSNLWWTGSSPPSAGRHHCNSQEAQSEREGTPKVISWISCEKLIGLVPDRFMIFRKKKMLIFFFKNSESFWSGNIPDNNTNHIKFPRVVQ